MLYAVSSTGGLTTGAICPVTDYTDDDDRMHKWYLSIWVDFSSDIGCAARGARKGNHEDAQKLEDAEKWVDDVCERLSEAYGLERLSA
jgi:hypothetical protein